MDTSTFIVLGIAIMFVSGVARALYEHNLLKTNPESWRAMKAAQEDKAERKRKAMGSAAVGGLRIARMFLKK